MVLLRRHVARSSTSTVAWAYGGYQDLQYIREELARVDKAVEHKPAEPGAAPDLAGR